MNLSQMQSGSVGGLGAALDELDVLISRLGSRQANTAINVLTLMDSISAELEDSIARGASVKAEEGQFESACGALQRRAAALVSEMGGKAALRAEREKRNPSPQAWWWRLDEEIARQRRTRLVNGLKIAGVVLMLVVALVIIYQQFLAPSPQVIASYRAVQRATTLASAGNYDQALAAIQQGLAASPKDSELLIWQGVLYHQQGSETQAEDSFRQARALLGRDDAFYVGRSQVYYAIGQLASADQDATAAVSANPNSEQAYYVLGSVQEAEMKTAAAFDSYQKAVDLANAANDASIAVEAKVKMGYLMQGTGMFSETPSHTP